MRRSGRRHAGAHLDQEDGTGNGGVNGVHGPQMEAHQPWRPTPLRLPPAASRIECYSTINTLQSERSSVLPMHCAIASLLNLPIICNDAFLQQVQFLPQPVEGNFLYI